MSRAFLFWRDERKISKIDAKGESKKKEDAVFIFTKYREDEDRILLLIGSSRVISDFHFKNSQNQRWRYNLHGSAWRSRPHLWRSRSHLYIRSLVQVTSQKWRWGWSLHLHGQKRFFDKYKSYRINVMELFIWCMHANNSTSQRRLPKSVKIRPQPPFCSKITNLVDPFT